MAEPQEHACEAPEAALLESARDLVLADLRRVDEEIHKQLGSHVPLVETISRHIVGGGGKRLRPLIVLLVARCLGNSEASAVKLAVVIEFLHTATLLHDDVVDISPTRRGRETAFSRWGGAASVLVGDVLFSRAFELMIELGRMELLRQISRATTSISEGEVAQLDAAGNVQLDQASYLKIIHAKTAALFEVSASTAALLSSDDTRIHAAARQFGLHFGMAYQLIDDWLDYSGDAQHMGKEPGNDLLEGTLTLPVIHALSAGSQDDAATIKDAFRRRNLHLFTEVAEAVQRSGGLIHTRTRAQEYARTAMSSLMVLPDNACRDALINLIRFNSARQT